MGIGTGIGTGIGITEEHRALAHSVRGWLARAVPPGEVRKLLDAGSPAPCGVRPAYWEALAGQGLTGIQLPEGCGAGAAASWTSPWSWRRRPTGRCRGRTSRPC